MKEHQLFDMNTSIAALKNYRGNYRAVFLFHICYLNTMFVLLARTHASFLTVIRCSTNNNDIRIKVTIPFQPR